MSKQLTTEVLDIVQLYPNDMNIYGDWGNALTLQRRAQWHGYSVNLHSYDVGDSLPKTVDIIVGGGGQDSGQLVIQHDLLALAGQLKALADDGVPMLMVCGLYQMFGRFFRTKDGQDIKGIGLLDIETHAGSERLIGNIITASETFGDIVGYENHSGLTYLGGKVEPLGTVKQGAGNNGQDQTEGARYRNVIGTYLHGSVLPKNPLLADWLIEQAALRRYGEFSVNVIDDRFAEQARAVAMTRPR